MSQAKLRRGGSFETLGRGRHIVKGDFARKALLATFALCAFLMFFGGNGQVIAGLLFFFIALPLIFVVGVSLWRTPKQPTQPKKTLVSSLKLLLGLALIVFGVLVIIDGSSRSGPAALIAIFGVPIVAVGLLPLVDGLKGIKK
jgi:archaellum biogenesis protein FlaJ (TadC family)